jgi:glutamyl-tRNA synthetase
MLGPDGQRLAKRHGAVSLADRAALGQSPAQIRGELMAGVGLAEPGEEPSMDVLLERFAPEVVASAAYAERRIGLPIDRRVGHDGSSRA